MKQFRAVKNLEISTLFLGQNLFDLSCCLYTEDMYGF